MEHYFPFHKLQEYYDILSAVFIFSSVVFVVYVLAALYYWNTKELKDRK